MQPLAKSWPVLFAVLCVVLAATDFWHHVSPTAVGLLALATAPWSLPWFADRVQSLKIGTTELNFRQLEQKVDDQQKAVAAALSSGIGSPGSASSDEPDTPGRSHAIVAAPDRGDARSSYTAPTVSDTENPEDPNKNQFGGKPIAGGRKLSAQVKPFPGSTELFLICSSVISIDPARPLIDDTPVTFYLHDSFNQKENQKLVKNGTAVLEFVSRGAFTMGAVVHEAQDVPLELDLAKDVPDAPQAFTSI
jgi:hypothetical protein